jgi:hypothetical protein
LYPAEYSLLAPLRDGRRFSSLAFMTTSVDQEMQGSRHGAPRCGYAGKKSLCVVWGVWGVWGTQASQDETSFFADVQISHTILYRLIKEYAEDVGCSHSFSGSSESILERWVEMFTWLLVPIPIFQRTEVYEVYNIKCTGNAASRKGKIRKDSVWVMVASSEEWGVFRGRLPGHMEGLFKLRNSGGLAHRLCIVELLKAKDRGIADSSHRLLKVCSRSRKKMWVVNIRSILGIAHLFEVETGN